MHFDGIGDFNAQHGKRVLNGHLLRACDRYRAIPRMHDSVTLIKVRDIERLAAAWKFGELEDADSALKFVNLTSLRFYRLNHEET